MSLFSVRWGPFTRLLVYMQLILLAVLLALPVDAAVYRVNVTVAKYIDDRMFPSFYAYAAAMDGYGNVFITGRVASGSGACLPLAKVTSDGSVEWVEYLACIPARIEGLDLAVSGSIVFIAGEADWGSGREYGLLVAVDRGSGRPLWALMLALPRDPGALINNTFLTGVVASGGYVYAVGGGGAKPLLYYDAPYAIVMKVDASTGRVVWIRGVTTGMISDACVAPNGYIYVVGFEDRSVGPRRYFIAKLDPSGRLVWLRRTSLATYYVRDYRSRIVCTPDGGVIVSFYYARVVARFNGNGEPVWAVRLNTRITSIGLEDGRVVAVGGDAYIVLSARSGDVLEVRRLGPINAYFSAIAASKAGSVLVAELLDKDTPALVDPEQLRKGERVTATRVDISVEPVAADGRSFASGVRDALEDGLVYSEPRVVVKGEPLRKLNETLEVRVVQPDPDKPTICVYVEGDEVGCFGADGSGVHGFEWGWVAQLSRIVVYSPVEIIDARDYASASRLEFAEKTGVAIGAGRGVVKGLVLNSTRILCAHAMCEKLRDRDNVMAVDPVSLLVYYGGEGGGGRSGLSPLAGELDAAAVISGVTVVYAAGLAAALIALWRTARS